MTGNTLHELLSRIDGMDAARGLATLHAYNASVQTNTRFNANEKDGRRTAGLSIDKTNWANTLDTPPFEAYAVTCGITFTFGGLHISTSAEVIDDDGAAIPGLYACGEIVGGLFYFNYPGGTGLTSGAVFGRLAGTRAGAYAKGS